MKFTRYKTRTDEILLEEKMANYTRRSYEETERKYRQAKFIVFSPILLDKPTETSQENKDGLTPSPKRGQWSVANFPGNISSKRERCDEEKL